MALVKLCDTKDVPEGAIRMAEVGEACIAVYHTADGFFATEDECSHAQASLSEGEIEGERVVCPRHGGRFDVKTGKAVGLPATAPVKSYAVKVEDGAILVDLGT